MDIAVSNLALMDILNHLRVFAAMRRVLRPGIAVATERRVRVWAR